MDSKIEEKLIRCKICNTIITIYNSFADKSGNIICDKCKNLE